MLGALIEDVDGLTISENYMVVKNNEGIVE